MDGFEDFELEIHSLREAAQRHDSHDEAQVDVSHVTDIDDAHVAPRGTLAHMGMWGASRWRVIRTAIVGVCIVSLLALVLARSPESPAIVGNMLGIETPTPTVPLIAGMDTIYPMFSVPWGTLRVDGRVHTVQQGQYRPMRLSRGRHMLEYRAALFPTLRCTLSVPSAAVDTCPQVDTTSMHFELPVPQDEIGLVRTLDLGARPELLPANQRAALVAAIDSALREGTTDSTTVIPGERYAVAPDRIAVASQVLTASIAVKRAPLAGSASGRIAIGRSLSCADLCVDLEVRDGDASSWMLTFAATMDWRYTTPDGRIVAETPLVAPAGPLAYLSEVALGWVMWEHEHWVVRYAGADYRALVCNLTANLTSMLYVDLSAHETTKYSGESSTCHMSQHEIDGCYMTYQRQTVDGVNVPEAGFLFRLGVLLAVNEEAQRLFPALPMADAHDRDIASRALASGQP